MVAHLGSAEAFRDRGSCGDIVKKHKWSDPYRTAYLTTRTCVDCGMQKLTHHDGPLPWVDFRLDETVIPGPKVPPCDAAKNKETKPA